MKLVKALCCILLFCFLALTLHKTQYKRVVCVIRALCMRAKPKIVPGRGPSNINLGNFVFSFDVCCALQLVTSVNYA